MKESFGTCFMDELLGGAEQVCMREVHENWIGRECWGSVKRSQC